MEYYDMCENSLMIGIITYLYYKESIEKHNLNECLVMVNKGIENIDYIDQKMKELPLYLNGMMKYAIFKIAATNEKIEILKKVKQKIECYIVKNTIDFPENLTQENIENKIKDLENYTENIISDNTVLENYN